MHVNPLMPLGGSLAGTLPNPGLSADAAIQRQVFGPRTGLPAVTQSQVANFNAAQLLGSTWANPAAIGTGTPAAGTFTSITATPGGGVFGGLGGGTAHISVLPTVSSGYTGASGPVLELTDYFNATTFGIYVNNGGLFGIEKKGSGAVSGPNSDGTYWNSPKYHVTGVAGLALPRYRIDATVGSESGIDGMVANSVSLITTRLERVRVTPSGRVLVGTTTDDSVNLLQTPGPISVNTANGAYWAHGSSSELLTLSTVGTTTDTSGNLLPANSIIESVVARVTTTITTATDWKLGDATTAGRFNPAVATLTSGTTAVGLTHVDQTGAAGPIQSAAAKVRVTTTGTPGAGAIRITVFYRTFVAPTS